ncbi:PAS domain S-box protein [Rapidithrix thailandica]|uniref:histidine kinase n=1 Tax=Rapidithrix thailandica TaxID=413964 RepID=A0AAW9SKC5_9BACT
MQVKLTNSQLLESLHQSGCLLLQLMKGKIIDCNNTFTQLLQVNKEELLYTQLKDWIIDVPGALHKVPFPVFNENDENWHGEIAFNSPGGTVKWIQMHLTHHPDGLCIAVGFDITAQKNREKYLFQFHQFLEFANDGILISEAESGKCVDVNIMLCKMLGYTKEEILQLNVRDIEVGYPLHTKEQRKKHVEAIKRQQNFPKILIGIHKRKDGSTYPAEVTIHHEAYEGKGYFISIVRDTTSRIQTENKLQDTILELEEAQKFGNLGNWKYFFVNQKIEWSKQIFRSFGMPDEQSPPASVEDYLQLIHPDDRNTILETISKVQESQKPVNFEIRQWQVNTGTYRWFYARMKPLLDEVGDIIGLSGVNFDIHDRKTHEEQINAMLEQELHLNAQLAAREDELVKTNEQLSENIDQLNQRNEELDNLVYSISHDLRAPIASVLGLIKLAKDSDQWEDIGEYLEKQEYCIFKLDNYIKDILDYARNMRIEVKPEEIPIKQLILDTYAQYEFLKNTSKIQLVINISQTIPFHSDLFRLSIICNNLISNAIKYARTEKNRPYIKIQIDVEAQYSYFTFEDNGMGINERHLSKVFDMFYKADSHFQGAGIGLYIVKETVKKLKGNVQLHSESGKGTTITICVPNLYKGASSHRK